MDPLRWWGPPTPAPSVAKAQGQPPGPPPPPPEKGPEINGKDKTEDKAEGKEDTAITPLPEKEADPLHLLPLKKDPKSIDQMRSKAVQKFYRRQNDVIDELLRPLPSSTSNSLEDVRQRRKRLKLKIAIYGSLFANIVLSSLHLTAAIMSHSLAVIAAMSDACMDLLSGLIIIAANYLSKTRNKEELRLYPIGKSRFETVGIIIFGSLMSTVAIQIIIQAITRLVEHEGPPNLDTLSISLVATAIFIKGVLYVYCRLVPDPSAQILAQDHRNDIMLNGVGITLGILSDYLNLAYLDPAGAMFVALVMFRAWTITILEQVRHPIPFYLNV